MMRRKQDSDGERVWGGRSTGDNREGAPCRLIDVVLEDRKI